MNNNTIVVFAQYYAYIQPKCERYWLEELNKPLELPDRGFTVTVTGKKDYADYEIRDMTIKYVSVYICKEFITQTTTQYIF